MKIDKNRIVFASILAIIIVFIVAYTSLVLGGDEAQSQDLRHPVVPALEKETKIYTSKIEALEDLKQEREVNAPSIYPRELLDSMGVFDPAREKEKKLTIVDSITNWGVVIGAEEFYPKEKKTTIIPELRPGKSSSEIPEKVSRGEQKISSRDFTLKHREFFASRPSLMPKAVKSEKAELVIPAEVNGDQRLRTNDRIELLLAEEVLIGNRIIPENTVFYGFIRLQPNRVLIKVSQIGRQKIDLKAFDLKDGKEGIYIKNSFRARATKDLLGDVVQDINIAGFPQVGGIKGIFRKNNRNIRVTILDLYKFILKP